MHLVRMASKEDATSCPICQEFYRDPRFLRCGHSFCLECIKGVAGNNKWIFCPLCRSKVILRDGKVDQLPKNYVLNDILEDKGKTIQSMCLQHNKLLDIFCEQCDMVICSKCLSTQHRGHVIEDIDKTFKERNEQLTAFLAETELSVSKIQEKTRVIEQSRNALQKNADSIQKTVSNMFKKWFNGLQAKQNALLSYVRQEGDKKIQVCVEAESVLSKSLSTVTQLGEVISQTRGKDMTFIIQQYSSIRVRHEDTGRDIQLNVRTQFTPPEELKIEVCAPWIDEAIMNIKCTDLMKKMASPQPQKISEISKENTNLNREKKQLECENKFLKAFLSDLHKYSISHTKGITFENPSTAKPDTAVTTQYQQTQDVYNILREMERKYDILENERNALQITVEEMATTLFDEEYEPLPLNDAVKQISTKIDSLILDLESETTEKEELQDANDTLLMTNDSYRQNNEQLQLSLQAEKQCRSEEERKVSDLQKQVTLITDDLQSANTEISKLRGTNDAYIGVNANLQRSLRAEKQCRSEEERKVTDLQNQVILITDDLQSANTEISKLRGTNDVYRMGNEKLQRSLQAEKQCRSEEERKVSDLQNQMETLEKKIKRSHLEEHTLRGRNNELEEIKVRLIIRNNELERSKVRLIIAIIVLSIVIFLGLPAYRK